MTGGCPAPTAQVADAMAQRGKDQAKRKGRGPPSEGTLAKRANMVASKKAATAAATAAKATASGAALLAGRGVVRAVEPAAAASPAAQAPAASAAAHEAVAQAPANPAAAAAIPGQAAAERQNADLPPDIVAELDEDEHLKDAAVGPGVQQTYLKVVFDRLKEEVGGRAAPLLKPFLDLNDWWLRAVHAPKICEWLGIACDEPSYYVDIYVWLPDVRWGAVAMPVCPCCESSSAVGSHCWRDNHFGRRIVTLDTHYFTISRRYKCGACADAAAALKKAAKAAAQAAGLEVVADEAEAAAGGHLARAKSDGQVYLGPALPLRTHGHASALPAGARRGGVQTLRRAVAHHVPQPRL